MVMYETKRHISDFATLKRPILLQSVLFKNLRDNDFQLATCGTSMV